MINDKYDLCFPISFNFGKKLAMYRRYINKENRMEYFRMTDDKAQEVFVNLCNVLWVAFADSRYTITFNRCQSDALSITVPQKEYEDTKEKLMKVLISSTRVVLD
jgi:hypothetical protein